MPAKIRRIRGTNQGNFMGIASDFLIDFNKSLDPTGGTKGLLSFKQGKRSTRIKLYQDKNEDGKFRKKELIFMGKIKTSKFTYDELIDVSEGLVDKPTVRLKKQMHSCAWDIMKGVEPIVCTMDYVPTVYNLALTDAGVTVKPSAMGDFKDGGIVYYEEPLVDISIESSSPY